MSTYVYLCFRDGNIFIELTDGVKAGKVLVTQKELADNDTTRLATMLGLKFNNLANELRHLKKEPE